MFKGIRSVVIDLDTIWNSMIQHLCPCQLERTRKKEEPGADQRAEVTVAIPDQSENSEDENDDENYDETDQGQKETLGS